MTTFTQKVDKRSRKAMEGFLTDHYTYCDHYRIGYAHRVKLHDLDLPDYDIAEELIAGDNTLFTYHILDQVIDKYNDSWLGRIARISWAGRSGGYLVLHFTSGEFSTFDPAYDEEMYFDDLKWYTEIVQEFDSCVQEVYEHFRAMCEEV